LNGHFDPDSSVKLKRILRSFWSGSVIQIIFIIIIPTAWILHTIFYLQDVRNYKKGKLQPEITVTSEATEIKKY
jgi:hypothetical protein